MGIGKGDTAGLIFFFSLPENMLNLYQYIIVLMSTNDRMARQEIPRERQ